MAVGYNPRAVTDGLVLALDAGNTKSYSGSGTTWTDNVGGNNGTLTNGPYHTKGPFFSSGSVYFDDTSKYLDISSSSDFAYGTGDFTWECWVYIIQGGYALDHGSNGGTIVLSHTSVSLYYNTTVGTGSVLYTTGFGTIPTETWTHIAAVRSGGTTYLYTNGVLSSSASDSHNYGSQAVRIGQYGGGGSNYFGGYISDLRIVKGTAVYTSNFTPPTEPLTAVTNTKLLTCQGNTITDASSSAHSISANGDAAANLGFPKSAFVFNGGNDYISVSNSSSLNPLNNTLICWAKSDNSTWNDYGFLMSKRDVFVMHPSQGTKTVNYYYYLNGSWQNQDVTPSDITIWNMYACTWDGTSISAYLNGSLINSGTKTGPLNTSDTGSMFIGRDDGYPRYMDGNIAQVFMYNRALTASEIEQNYNATKGRYA